MKIRQFKHVLDFKILPLVTLFMVTVGVFNIVYKNNTLINTYQYTYTCTIMGMLNQVLKKPGILEINTMWRKTCKKYSLV